MSAPDPPEASRCERWLERIGRAFVMEIEHADGSRALIGLDPNWQGAPATAVVDASDGRCQHGSVTIDARIP
jgi:hypothetical protein